MIRVLDKEVADKIAAGEVIESPVSIVKELVENAVDAGAGSIVCEVKKGGKSYIRITDNGCGIEPEYLRTAFLRHATSKIRTADDLNEIGTLGFRGEALASIAAVTRCEVITKTAENKTGRRIVIHGGNVVSEEVTGCPDGTTFIVRDLFYNMPARSKFLKSDGAESGKIIDFMSRIALTKPEIRFRLINNGKALFSTSGNGSLRSAIQSIYKEKDFDELVEVDYRDEFMRIYGYTSKPSLSRTNRRSQYFFVNGRVVKSKVMEKALMEGYRERLFEGRYPASFLFLEIRPDLLDVNIHPNKKEVRFDNDAKVSDAIKEAIEKALATKDAVVSAKDPKADLVSEFCIDVNDSDMQDESSTSCKSSDFRLESAKTDRSSKQVDIKELLSQKREALEKAEEEKLKENEISEVDKIAVDKIKVYEENSSYSSKKIGFDDFDMNPGLKPFDFSVLRYDGAVFGTYIIAEDSDSFYLIDQHAAHERIFYEKLVSDYLSSEKHSQLLLTNFTIDVPLQMAEEPDEWMAMLSEMGYEIEPFGESTFVVRGIPQFMNLSEAEEFINTFIDSYDSGSVINNSIVIDKLITKSCKSAIKAHDYINDAEIKALMEQLAKCRNPFSCPHGRPTFIRFSIYELERMFKRA